MLVLYQKILTCSWTVYRFLPFKTKLTWSEAATRGVLKKFVKFTGKLLCQNLFFNKVSDLRPATLLKKILWYRYFPVNFYEIFKNTFFTDQLWTTASFWYQSGSESGSKKHFMTNFEEHWRTSATADKLFECVWPLCGIGVT